MTDLFVTLDEVLTFRVNQYDGAVYDFTKFDAIPGTEELFITFRMMRDESVSAVEGLLKSVFILRNESLQVVDVFEKVLSPLIPFVQRIRNYFGILVHVPNDRGNKYSPQLNYRRR